MHKQQKSEFLCCPGRPYSYPQLYFTPLTHQWQRPDFRPLQFERETRYSTKVPSQPCPGYRYEHEMTHAVIAYEKGNKKSIENVLRATNDLNIDEMVIVTYDYDSKRDFILRFARNTSVRAKTTGGVKVVDRGCSLRKYARGEFFYLYPLENK